MYLLSCRSPYVAIRKTAYQLSGRMKELKIELSGVQLELDYGRLILTMYGEQ